MAHPQHSRSDSGAPPATWLICESTDRWQRAIQARGYRLDREEEFRLVVRAATLGEVRALATHTWPLIVLWELPLPNAMQEPSRESPQESNRSLQSTTDTRSPSSPTAARIGPAPPEMFKAVSLLARHQPAPLQFIAWPTHLPANSLQLNELNLAARQLGAELVLTGPEQIDLASRFVSHFLNRSRNCRQAIANRL